MEHQTKNEVQQGGFSLPQCPHCGKRINPFYAWSIKSKGEFRCNHCGGFSDIKLAKPILWMGLIAVILAGILLLVFIFTGCMHLGFLPAMLAPFFVFTALSPFFVRLTPTRLSGQNHRPPTSRPMTEQFSLDRDPPKPPAMKH